jgi:hypothetical protein
MLATDAGERVVRPGADDSSRWTKPARVSLRHGLLLIAPCARPRRRGEDVRILTAKQRCAGPAATNSKDFWTWQRAASGRMLRGRSAGRAGGLERRGCA